MRCVLVGPSAPLRGGIALDNDALAHALRQADHTVEQVSFRRLYPHWLFPGRSQYDVTHQSPSQAAHSWLDSITPWNWWQTAAAIAQMQPHLVTLQWWHPFFAPCYATLLSRLRRLCPTALRLLISHNTRPHEPLPGQDTALRLVARRCDGIIVHSRSEYEIMTAVVPDATVRVVDYPLLDTPRALPERTEAQRHFGVSGRTLLFFGYVRPYKGLDLLLRALAQIPTSVGVSLLIAGEFYEPIASYRALVQELGITERVRILDRYVGEPEWPQLFAATDALVLPYRAASQSMSIALAYNFGKPVIVTRVGGLAETVEDGKTGLIADPNPSALAATMQRFYSEFLAGPYEADIAARRGSLGWEPFIRLLEHWGRGQ